MSGNKVLIALDRYVGCFGVSGIQVAIRFRAGDARGSGGVKLKEVSRVSSLASLSVALADRR